jgi:GNAT superfamily N-acetyltransferase
METRQHAEEAPLVIRDGEEDDRPYILSTWLNAFALSRTARMIDRPLYFVEQKKVIERLLTRSRVRVAVNPEDLNHIFGYIVGEPPFESGIALVHYCYVKSDYRELGIGRRLIRSITEGARRALFTHLPPATIERPRDSKKLPVTPGELVQKLCPGAVFNPYAAFER